MKQSNQYFVSNSTCSGKSENSPAILPKSSSRLNINSLLISYNTPSILYEASKNINSSKREMKLSENCPDIKTIKGRSPQIPKVAMNTFELHMKQIFFQEKDISVEEWMHMGERLIEMMEPGVQELINLNYGWCIRLMKILKKQSFEKPTPSPDSSCYEMFSEPQSEINATIDKTSQQWKKHQMIEERKQRDTTQDFLIVDQTLKKTKDNKKKELQRIRKQFRRLLRQRKSQ